jgi:2-desacetyl-2-hydroxyethyl bacteriochlorophyllide A dehydrogenase
MQQDVRAFWVTTPGRGEIRAERLDDPGPGDVRVRTLYSGISRGTEALVFNGRVPESEWHRMRAPYQSGDFPAPVKYGYANVGLVEEGPAHLRGRHVFTLFPHQTSFVVPANAVHVLPENVPPARAILAANLETAINGLWDARPHVGDRILVVGAGTVGCLVAWLAARIIGCEVQLADVNGERSQVAAALGVAFTAPQSAVTDIDVVLHASGSSDGLALALDRAGFEATVTELSWFGDRMATLPLGRAFHVNRLTIQSSQVGTIPSAQRARWTHGRRMQLALRLLADPALDALITGESPFETLPEVMAAIAADGSNTLCHRIRYV